MAGCLHSVGTILLSNYINYWQERIREVQGAICVASIFQLVVGYTGLLGVLLRFITPLTIGPSVAMIGLSLFDVASLNASKHWGVAIGSEHREKAS